jgi:hypothetical protein
MNFPRASILVVLLSVFLTACSTVDSRVKDNQAAFDALPPETQQKIRAGKVEVGYTPQMVTMALGKPDRVYTRTTEKGTSEVWAYRDSKPAFSFGLGVGGGGGGTRVGSGIGITTGGDRYDDKLRVVLSAGKVTTMETSSR